jgi:hypothetical protein
MKTKARLGTASRVLAGNFQAVKAFMVRDDFRLVARSPISGQS